MNTTQPETTQPDSTQPGTRQPDETPEVTHPTRDPGRRAGTTARLTAILTGGYALAAGGWVLATGSLPLVDRTSPAQQWLSGTAQSVLSAVLPLLTAALAVLAGRLAGSLRRGHRPPRWVASGCVVLAAALAAVVVGWLGDVQVLAILGYLPLLLVNAVLGLGMDVAPLDAVFVGHQAITMALVPFVLLTAVQGARARLSREQAQRAARRATAWAHGRAAVAVTLAAAAIPLLYATTRLAWAAGVPLGLSASTLEELEVTGMDAGAVGLGAASLTGAVLTVGLLQRWGHTFPRWLPWLGGRAVPTMLAVVPASIVAAVLMPAAVGFLRVTWPAMEQAAAFSASDWGAYGPLLLLPVWSVLLAAATWAYWLRRRGARAPGDRSVPGR